MGAGVAIPLVTVLYFKFVLAPPNDLFAGQSLSLIIDNLTNSERYLEIAAYFWNIVLEFGSARISIPLILIIFLISMKRRVLSQDGISAGIIIGAIICLMLMGFFSIYLITPNPLIWQLKYSADRVLLHIYPAILWIVFLITRTPEEVLINTQNT